MILRLLISATGRSAGAGAQCVTTGLGTVLGVRPLQVSNTGKLWLSCPEATDVNSTKILRLLFSATWRSAGAVAHCVSTGLGTVLGVRPLQVSNTGKLWLSCPEATDVDCVSGVTDLAVRLVTDLARCETNQNKM